MIQLIKDIGSALTVYLEECAKHKVSEMEPDKVRFHKGYFYE